MATVFNPRKNGRFENMQVDSTEKNYFEQDKVTKLNAGIDSM